MTSPSDEMTVSRKAVVVLDICSSTVILENLLSTENERTWRNVLIKLKETLNNQTRVCPFTLYKFLGDGWVLLFDEEKVTPEALVSILRASCESYDYLYTAVARVLTIKPPRVGLTFGLDEGKLVGMEMNARTEYVGRALNVASRLQGALSEVDPHPDGKMLISNNAAARFGFGLLPHLTIEPVDIPLRNIAGGAAFQAQKHVVHSRRAA